MSDDIVISVENLGKKYRIKHQQQRPRYVALRDVISHKITTPFRWLRNRSQTSETRSHTSDLRPLISARASRESFWALKDVSLEVKQGEVVGIIGRNGAGKSTLLKILSRITEPTAGRVRIKGRVASLLEVGTGFHPELTGRENIFLNGAILGMTRAEIKRKFDEIVAFSEVERFLDTPVKWYSSGMYVRLAFGVAAHLEPEILIVDEVLTVGDAEFQKKCLGKMQDVSRLGRTVLFVSHDMGNVSRLCEHGLLLNEGKVEFQGEMMAVVSRYQRKDIAENSYADLSDRGERSGSGDGQFQSIELLNVSVRCSTFAFGSPMTIRTVVRVRNTIGNAQVAVAILTDDGIPVYLLENLNEGMLWPAKEGEYCFEVTLPKVNLLPGGYKIDLWMGDYRGWRVDYVRGVVAFQVVQTPSSGLALPLDRRTGLVFTPSRWNCTRTQA